MRVTQINVENAPTQTEELRYLSNPKFSKSILPRNPHGTHPQLSKKQVNWFSASVGPWPNGLSSLRSCYGPDRVGRLTQSSPHQVTPCLLLTAPYILIPIALSDLSHQTNSNSYKTGFLMLLCNRKKYAMVSCLVSCS